MANDKNIRIGITTTADTSGAEKTVTSIDRLLGIEERRKQSAADFLTAAQAEVAEVERMVASARKLEEAKQQEAKAMRDAADAALKEQQQLDVLEAKRRVAERAAKAHAASVQNFGSVVTQVGYQVTDFTTQVSMGTNAFVAFAQQAPQAIGAIQQFGQGMKLSWNAAVGFGTGVGIITTAVAVGTQLVASEYAKMKAALEEAKEAERRFKEQLEFTRQAIEDMRRQKRMDFISSVYEADATALERQVQALERINELRAAQGGAAAAQASAAVTVAQNTGGDVTAAKANQIAVGVANQIDALDSKVSESEAAVAQAQAAFDKATATMNETRRFYNEFDDEWKEASANLDKTKEALDKAQEDNENLKQIKEAEKQAILANAEASISDLGKEVTDGVDEKVSDMVGKVKSEMQAVADKQGQSLAFDAKGAMDRFGKLITDQIPDGQQLDQIAAAVRQFRGSQSTMLSGMTENFDALLKESGNLANEVVRQKSELALLRNRIAQFTGTEF